ncbi:MAG TPA: ABC transporter ATP-binding protein [Propionibacteriaceae bacterium]|nr:ABC transporter ATP-binding protein [Propionibacteriaceae bacterium]
MTSPGPRHLAPDTVIEVTDLRVIRGKRVVLPKLSVGIPRGRVTGLLGPSGSGKSTLIRAIVGVQRVESGTITVLGLPAGCPELRHRVSYLTQAPSVYDDLSVGANTLYFGRLAGRSKADAKEAIARVGLTDHTDALARNLSGGELSRASLAVALVSRPEVLVLDEPTVGLDPVLRRSLWGMFHELADEGATLLVSSHVMDEASRCDSLILLREGEIIANDTPAGLLEQTGTSDTDDAFLALIDAKDAAVAAAANKGGTR